MAGNTRESLDRKPLTVTRNLPCVMDGDTPKHEYVVNPKALGKN